jgi:hypothetical protein
MRKRKLLLVGVVFLLCIGLVVIPVSSTQVHAGSKGETFSAMAYLPTGAGPRMMGAGATANLTIYVERYSTDDEAKAYAATLLEKGPDELLKALQDAPAIGRVTMQRRVGSFELKFIRSRPTETGRRIVGVCDRPVGFLEAYFSGRSLDNKFGIVIIDLQTNKKGKEEGQGELIYAAKVKVLEGNKVEVENYGIDPVKLMGVRKY